MIPMIHQRPVHYLSVWPIASFVLALIIAFGARADLAPEKYYGVSVEDASAQASGAGGNSVLKLRIVNEGTEPLIFLGVVSERITNSRILAKTDDKTRRVFESVRIPADEELDLISSHLVVELLDLKSPFRSGETVTLKLSFPRGDIPIDIHIH